jgi:tetratricopeptide (TPR) repeat protein
MTLAIVLAQLEGIKPSLMAAGRENFRVLGTVIITRAALSAEETDDAFARLEALAEEIPIILVGPKDREEASRLCRIAAGRLIGAPWYRAVTETWPAPIAHEVAMLVAHLNGTAEHHPSPEAALLQLRDLSETLVKLPAAILARRLIDRGGEDAEAMRRALGRVSGGEWIALARDAARRLQRAEPGGKLGTLAALFTSGTPFADLLNRLASARNNAIGHGALRPNPAETARLVCWFVAGQGGDPQPFGPSGEIAAGVTILTGLARAAEAQPWQGLSLEAESEGDRIALMGSAALHLWHQDDRHHRHEERTLPLWLAIADEAPLRLSPLVSARICQECARRDVFFFDTIYDRKPWKVDFLDYGRGHKSRFGQDAVGDLLAELQPEPPGPQAASGASLDSRAAIEALDAMRIDRRYRSPTYLRKPFSAFLHSHDRGLYWLQAPAHIGKTMFTLGLSSAELGDQPIAEGFAVGKGGAIASFFCKREYRDGWTTFLNALEERLKVALDLGDHHQYPPKETVTGAAEPRAAFLAWLQAWQALAASRYPRLLVVIDGLDETDAPGPNGKSLLSLLPKADDMPAGLYLLLTSRPVAEQDCPHWLGPALMPLATGEHCEVRIMDLADQGYRSLMTDYARDRLGLGKGAAEIVLIADLLERSEGRFVFFSFLVEQRLFGGEREGAARGAALYQAFLEGLEDRYGSKRADGLVALLASLTAAELAHGWIFGEGALRDEATGGILEPMPRAFLGLELSSLAAIADMDEQTPEGRRLSLVFVEALLLLQGVFWVSRGESGTPRYRLGLKEFAPVLELCQPQALARARARMAGACLDAIDALGLDFESDGTPDAVAEQIMRALFPLLPALVATAGSEPLRHRFETAPVGDVGLWLEARNQGEKAPSLRQVQWYSALLCACGRACGPQDSPEQRCQDVARTYVNRGIAKTDSLGFGPAAAIGDYAAAIALMEALRDAFGADWPLPWYNELAATYMNCGNAKQSAPGFGPAAAIADYNTAIALMEALQGASGADWPLSWREQLAKAYTNRGVAKQSAPGFGPAAAITDYNAAVELREALRDELGAEWPLPWRNDLAAAYSNRGNVKQSAPGFGPIAAIADYDAAIAVMEALRDALGANWPMRCQSDLAAAYSNRGNVKQSAPGFGPAAAIGDYDVAIALMEALRDALGAEWPLSWRNDLANVYMNRGNAKQSAPGLGPAARIADYDVAVGLMEWLRDRLGAAWPLPWRNDLAKAYMNRGNAKQSAPGFGPGAAIADYEAAIVLMEALRDALGADWPLPWRHDLAAGYLNLGNSKQSSPGFGPVATILDYDTAIKLMEALQDALGADWPLLWCNQLAGSYMNRGVAKQSAPDFGPEAAIADYDAALTIWSKLGATLGEDLPPDWENLRQRTIAKRQRLIDARETDGDAADG